MSVQTDYNSRRSNHRNDRAGDNNNAGRMDGGRKVNKSPNPEEQLHIQGKRVPQPASNLPVVVMQYNKKGELEDQIKDLQAQLIKADADHNTALQMMSAQIDELARDKLQLKSENETLNAQLAAKSQVIAEEKVISVSDEDQVVLAKPGDDKAIQWPTIDNLKKIYADLLPVHQRYYKLGSEIDQLRNDSNKVRLRARKYTSEELKEKNDKFAPEFNRLHVQFDELVAQAKDAITNLTAITNAATRQPVAKHDLAAISSYIKKPVSEMEAKKASFDLVLNQCKTLLKDFISDDEQVHARFTGAQNEINSIGGSIKGNWLISEAVVQFEPTRYTKKVT